MTTSQPARNAQPDIAPLPKLAIILAFVSFVVPLIGSITAFAVATAAKIQLPKSPLNRTNRGIATIAQVTALITALLYGGFLWYAEIRWGNNSVQ